MSLKKDYVTVNQLIAILQQAKIDRGGNARVQIFDRGGDKIKPNGMEEGTMIRGREKMDYLYFSEER